MNKTWDNMTQAEREALLADPPPERDIIYVGDTNALEGIAASNQVRNYLDAIRDDTKKYISVSVMWKRIDRNTKALVVGILYGVLNSRRSVARALDIPDSTVWRLFNHFMEINSGIQADCQAKIKEIQATG